MQDVDFDGNSALHAGRRIQNSNISGEHVNGAEILADILRLLREARADIRRAARRVPAR